MPHIKTPSPFNAEIRTETYAVDKNGRAVHPDVVTQILNSGVDKSLELQKSLGIKTTSALIDVDKFEGRDMRHASYGEKRKVLEQIAAHSPDFHLPDTAFTTKDKASLLSLMLSKKHPQSKEGLVVHDIHSPEVPFAKAKIIDEHDVFVTGIFKEEDVKAGRKPMAGGIIYSWDEGGKPVGKIGTGFNHAEKEDMLKNPSKYIGRVARVKALDLSRSKVLVKPSFSMWHVEKNL
jgi:ATP-dependent DNA ligase